jgi:histone deacetylase complex regulatory component SIN3
MKRVEGQRLESERRKELQIQKAKHEAELKRLEEERLAYDRKRDEQSAKFKADQLAADRNQELARQQRLEDQKNKTQETRRAELQRQSAVAVPPHPAIRTTDQS